MGEHSASRLASMCGKLVAAEFGQHRDAFRAITHRAPQRFAKGQTRELWHDTVERIDLYRRSVDSAVARVGEQLKARRSDRRIWSAIKAVYSALIAEREDWELAETFFNSVTRRIFATHGVDPRIEFIDSDFAAGLSRAYPTTHRTFAASFSVSDVIRRVLKAYRLSFDDEYDASDLIATRLQQRLAETGGLAHIERIEVFDAVFYRGERAHLITRVCSGLRVLPMVIVGRTTPEGPRIEAVLLHESDVSILFSFTRAYFFVDIQRPGEAVAFLRSLLPRKRVAELYNAIGCDKHGKTEFYRDLRQVLRSSQARLDFAPGTAGLVMVTFALPGYDAIFKVIRDRFSPPKVTNREKVMAKYRFVRRHDRAGRLVEAQDFQHLAFRRSRFTPELLDELLTACGESVVVDHQSVVLNHVYVERQVTPLNLVLEHASDADVERALLDFGRAIKDLAYTNVFPGDLLTKNFGVTRNGRVVFYDYDELVLLEECNFRRIPPPRTEEDEFSAEPWYRVADNDIFPEEFRTFMGIPRRWMSVFEAEHGDLFDAGYWKRLQASVTEGQGPEVQPFSHRCLL
ncbi:MAG: bifunctional isocitrate dehydrogenase kinase/phosphatase [Myxococcota bacterium]